MLKGKSGINIRPRNYHKVKRNTPWQLERGKERARRAPHVPRGLYKHTHIGYYTEVTSDNYFSSVLISVCHQQRKNSAKYREGEREIGREMERDGEMKHSRFSRICVFCGSSQGNKSSYQDAAIQLAQEMVFYYFPLFFKNKNKQPFLVFLLFC